MYNLPDIHQGQAEENQPHQYKIRGRGFFDII